MNQEKINREFEELVTPLMPPQEMRQELAGRFMRHEMPNTIDELQSRVEALNAEGEKLGFNGTKAYVDSEGQLVTIARRAGDTVGHLGMTSQDKRCRISIGDHVMEIDLPPRWQGEGGRQMRDGSGVDSIYDFNSYVANEFTDKDIINEVGAVKGPSLEGLPEDMQMLIDRYGKCLTLRSSYEGSYATGYNVYVPHDVDISGSKSRFERVRTEISLDSIEGVIIAKIAKRENEAHEIENNAQTVAENVRKGLFMSARKHNELREKAYRESLDDQLYRHR